ncbi:aromatic ring-hydroxylating dioxygenase subunit alpha [soil metagenome]
MTSVSPLLDMRAEFAKTRRPRETAHQMPGRVYTSAAVADEEKKRIFMDTWLCVGREEEVANPGDFMTGQITDEPFIISRDKAGQLHGLLNMCRHRGVPVAEGSGNTRGFSCPYHAWYYDLQGKLLASPHMGKSEVDLANCRLKTLSLATWRGWIFVSFNQNPVPFADFIAPFDKELWWFKSEDVRLAEKVVLKVDCNWKLLVENLIDIYHVPVLHKASFGGFLKTERDKIQFKLLDNGGWVYEQEARPHSKAGNQLFPTLPWLEGMGIGTSLKAGIFPNLNLSLRYDSLRMWQVWPVSQGKCEIHLYSLFAPSAFDSPHFAANYEEYKTFLLAAIMNEDGPMVVQLQQAMASEFYDPGPLSHMEGAVHHLMNHYLDVLTGEPSRKRDPSGTGPTTAAAEADTPANEQAA